MEASTDVVVIKPSGPYKLAHTRTQNNSGTLISFHAGLPTPRPNIDETFPKPHGVTPK